MRETNKNKVIKGVKGRMYLQCPFEHKRKLYEQIAKGE